MSRALNHREVREICLHGESKWTLAGEDYPLGVALGCAAHCFFHRTSCGKDLFCMPKHHLADAGKIRPPAGMPDKASAPPGRR